MYQGGGQGRIGNPRGSRETNGAKDSRCQCCSQRLVGGAETCEVGLGRGMLEFVGNHVQQLVWNVRKLTHRVLKLRCLINSTGRNWLQLPPGVVLVWKDAGAPSAIYKSHDSRKLSVSFPRIVLRRMTTSSNFNAVDTMTVTLVDQ